jgi:bifunctional DNase/RNase
MNNDSVVVSVKGVMPTSNGCAIFLGNDDKTFVIYVDPAIGNAINMTINQVKKERPLTHDLIGLILKGLETKIERVLINDVDEGTFFARIILQMENELGKKIIELEARPSDSIVLALQMKQEIHVSRKVLENVEDMTEILERILRKQD